MPIKLHSLSLSSLALAALSGVSLAYLAALPQATARPVPEAMAQPVPEAIVVATSPTYTWNGVTVSRTGRLFVSMQRDTPVSYTHLTLPTKRIV